MVRFRPVSILLFTKYFCSVSVIQELIRMSRFRKPNYIKILAEKVETPIIDITNFKTLYYCYHVEMSDYSKVFDPKNSFLVL
jgi:hypothetical protein